MSNTQIAPGNYGSGQINPAPAGSSFGSLTATIDRYDLAYVAAFPNPGPRWFIVVPKSFPVGVTTVSVTINGTDTEGNPLTPLVIPFDLDGAAPPPLALSIVLANLGTTTTTPPADPGSAGPITLSL